MMMQTAPGTFSAGPSSCMAEVWEGLCHLRHPGVSILACTLAPPPGKSCELGMLVPAAGKLNALVPGNDFRVNDAWVRS